MQLVLLSTTLPPTIIPKLMDFYHLLSNTTIIRQLANRPELIYILKKRWAAHHSLHRQCKSWTKRDYRGLIFCHPSQMDRSWWIWPNMPSTWAIEPRWLMKNTGMPIICRWIQGFERVIIATTTFSIGNDYPHVWLVIQMDKLFNMLKFTQDQQGRASKAGQAARCNLLTQQSATRQSIKEAGVMTESKLAIYNCVFTYGLKQCLWYSDLYRPSLMQGSWYIPYRQLTQVLRFHHSPTVQRLRKFRAR